jgi:HEAT repeat protein
MPKDLPIKILKEKLKDQKYAKKIKSALERIASQRGIRFLVETLKDDELRWQTALVLGRKRSKFAVYPLLELLAGESNPETRRSVVWVLGQICSGLKDSVPKQVIGVLLKILGNSKEDMDVRRNAAQALGNIGDERAVESLIESLRERDLRWNASLALGMFREKWVIKRLKSCLKHPDVGIRQGATWALRQIRSKDAIDALIEAIQDKDADVRKGAVWALRQIHDKSNIKKMIQLLASDNEITSKAAAEVLSKVGYKGLLREVEPYITTFPPETSKKIRKILKELGF